MVPAHQDGILYEDFNKKFEIEAFKSSHALNTLEKWPDDACEMGKYSLAIELK